MQGVYKEWNITAEEPVMGTREASVVVHAVKGEETRKNTFKGIVSRDGLISAVKGWIDSIERMKSLENLALDFAEPVAETPTEPTADELARQTWEADFARLEKVKRLVDCAVLTGTEAPVVALRNKVKTGFKAEYLN